MRASARTSKGIYVISARNACSSYALYIYIHICVRHIFQIKASAFHLSTRVSSLDARATLLHCSCELVYIYSCRQLPLLAQIGNYSVNV